MWCELERDIGNSEIMLHKIRIAVCNTAKEKSKFIICGTV